MRVRLFDNLDALGKASAEQAAESLNETVRKYGTARLLLSTGASQFPFFKYFVGMNVEWSRIEMFHLDEYVGMSPEHPASFQRYLRERFTEIVRPGKVHLIDGTKPPEETIGELTELLSERPVDLGLIGIGENGHIAFNDPPADFETRDAYKVVTLSETCIQQQLHEGWFASAEEAYKQAISMTCHKIMECGEIISVVPYAVKAQAVLKTLACPVTNMVPATLLRQHPRVTLYCDPDSSSLVSEDIIKKYR